MEWMEIDLCVFVYLYVCQLLLLLKTVFSALSAFFWNQIFVKVHTHHIHTPLSGASLGGGIHKMLESSSYSKLMP
jgi:hypothetical protein